MRVQNEGTGKSSWWVLNPDANHAMKTPRRPRALTMDSKSYERQRRGRGAAGLQLGLPRSRVPSGMDPSEMTSPSIHSDPIDPFQMEYRVRASSFGGHLSPPLETVQEPDTNDPSDLCRFTPTMPGSNLPPLFGDGSETLSETLADIFAGDLKMSSSDVGSSEMMSPGSRVGGYCGENQFGGHEMDYFRPLDVYPSQHYGNSSGYPCMSGYPPTSNGCRNTTAMECGGNADHMGMGERNGMGMMLNDCAAAGAMRNRVGSFNANSSRPQLGYHSMSLTEMQDVKPQMSCVFQNGGMPSSHPNPQSSNVVFSSNPMMQARPDSGWFGGQPSTSGTPAQPQPSHYGSQQQQPRLTQAAIARILAERPHLMAKMQQLIKMKREQLAAQLQQHHQQMLANSSMPAHGCGNGLHMAQEMPGSNSSPLVTSSTSDIMSTTPPMASTSFFPTDLDLNGLDFSAIDMDCDIDQVIKHEITLDGKLDFMFDGLPTTGSVSN